MSERTSEVRGASERVVSRGVGGLAAGVQYVLGLRRLRHGLSVFVIHLRIVVPSERAKRE